MVLRNLELAGITSYFAAVITGDNGKNPESPRPTFFWQPRNAIGREPAQLPCPGGQLQRNPRGGSRRLPIPTWYRI
jgi:hypothetical protein